MVLHILLIILKIIGIIIAVLLGLILLLLVILLCVPVRYRMEASMPGEIKESTVRGRVTWLLRLIRIDASFEEQELKWRVRIAWKSFGSEPKKEVTHGEENTDREETRKEQRVESSRGLPKVEKESAEEKTIVESGQAASKDMEERSGKKTEKSPESILQKTHERPEKVQPEKNSEKPEKTDKIEKKEEKTGRFEKIKCTIVKFCDKIKHTVGHAEEKLESLSEKKDKIIKELEDPVHQKVFSKAKKETGKLLKRWKPKVIKGTVRFGFEDPCHTGQALAAFSIIYPFIGEFLSIEPNFERRILKGDVKVCGGFRMVPLVCFLWNLVWCREIRKTYHDIREFQL